MSGLSDEVKTKDNRKRSDYSNWTVKSVNEIGKGIQVQILTSPTGEEFMDIRRYFKGKPTKKGVRVNFKTIKELL